LGERAWKDEAKAAWSEGKRQYWILVNREAGGFGTSR